MECLPRGITSTCRGAVEWLGNTVAQMLDVGDGIMVSPRMENCCC